MATETTTVAIPSVRTGIRFAIAATVFLAAIALFVAVTFDPPVQETSAGIAEPSVVDYALRHVPVDAPVTDYGPQDYALRHLPAAIPAVDLLVQDYALRHVPEAAPAADDRLRDYALRHPTTGDVRFENSHDYALRHRDS